MPRNQVSVYRTIGPLVSEVAPELLSDSSKEEIRDPSRP